MTEQRIDLKYKPREWQKELHQKMATHRFVCCCVHRRGGKSVAAINALGLFALAHSNARLAYMAPTLKQAKKISWQLREHAEDVDRHRRDAGFGACFGGHFAYLA